MVSPILVKVLWRLCRGENRKRRSHQFNTYQETPLRYGETFEDKVGRERDFSQSWSPRRPEVKARTSEVDSSSPNVWCNLGSPMREPDCTFERQRTMPAHQGSPYIRQHTYSQEPANQGGQGPDVDAVPDQARSVRVEPEPSVVQRHVQEYPVRRTFSGENSDVWNEFLQYFENLAELNSWGPESPEECC